MEQRRLRLGDILDDYCPRERRVTNHAIVAMIEEDIKQTRCTTCDSEHAYKGARVPRRRKKETPAALYKEVLAAMPENDAPQPLAAAPAEDVVDRIEEPEPVSSYPTPEFAGAPEATAEPEPEMEPLDAEPGEAAAVEDGPVHRPLIRATLPRPEGQKLERPIPEFTIRHSNGRNNGPFRGDVRMKARPHGGNGNRPHGRFAGARPGVPGGRPAGRGGSAAGFRSGPPRHGGRKRSR